MTYEETIEYLYKALPMYQRIGGAAYRATLDNAYELDKLSGQPHKAFKTIHIAGTNGKGSVSHMLASVLQSAGYKTGLYTSPHLLDFRERIKINGQPVTKEFVKKYIRRNMCFFETIKPSFFEMSVFMAFCYFKINKVDIAVIETGLGGRLDTTNIISPLVSVITNIGKDHTQILGNNLRKIAKEKAGIIKPAIPVVIGETNEQTQEVFNARSYLMESPIYYADQEYKDFYTLRTLEKTAKHNIISINEEITVETDLLGSYQSKNIITTLKTIDLINEYLPVSREKMLEGFKNVKKNTGLRGRWEEISYNPLTVCDVGHNKEGLTESINQINQTAHKTLHMLLGFVNDKNIENILSILPKTAQYYFTRFSVPRSSDPFEIAEIASKYNLNSKIFQSVKDAYYEVLQNAEPEDLIYIGGSTFVVADFLKMIS